MTAMKLSVVFIVFIGIVGMAQADWEALAPGIDYQEFTVSGPNNCFVARMDRSNPDCLIDSCLGRGELIFGTETVSGMANRYEGAVNYWGQSWGSTNDVVVAINGDFWDTTLGQPQSGHISSGWYVKRFTNYTGGSGFVWQLDGDAYIGGCVTHTSSRQKVQYLSTGQDQNFNGINSARENDQLVIYTPQYNEHTNTDTSGSEVLVRMSRPMLIMPTPNYARGTVVEVRQNLGSTPIPFDCIVLSAKGSAETKLLANVSVGAEVGISQEITDYESDCSTPGGRDWTKTYAAIGGSFYFLKDGVVQSSTDPGATDRHPRTAVAFNENYIFFIVVDGRSSISVGMSMSEIGNFCKNTLGATEGLNQDGGGSSAMWVDGEIKNVPSDGAERATYNGLMMIRNQPIVQSPRLSTGRTVEVRSGTTLRLGPGTHYGEAASVSTGQQGQVVEHALNGVTAEGQSWWYCQFGSATGWLSESALTSHAPHWETYR